MLFSKDVLLVVCPMWGTCLPPMGVAYIAAYLEDKGVPCDVQDMNIALYAAASADDKRLWQMENFHLWSQERLFTTIRDKFSGAIEASAQRIVDQKYNIAGFSLNGANILFSIEMAKAIRRKSPDIRIVFGGASCNFQHRHPRMPFRFLTSSTDTASLLPEGVVDLIVMGEGEEAFLEIVAAYKAGTAVTRAGVVPATVHSCEMIQLPPYIADLDALPFPAWEKLPLEKYEVQGELPMIFSRGCINRCAFCNDWRMWNGRFRSRSAKNIFAEIKALHDRFGKKTFRCNDLLFNGNLKVLDELTDLIIGSGLKINWTAQGVVRTDMKVELLRKLKKSGMTTIIYGVESLADNVLEKMGKPFTFADIQIMLKRTKEAGINTWINLIMGFPGETEEDFQITKRRLEEVRDYLDTVSSLNPCNITAATDLEISPEKFGIVFPPDKDWCEGWETADGRNTLEIRKRRAQEIFKYLRSLRIQTNFVGIYDGDSPSQDRTALKKAAPVVKPAWGRSFRRVFHLPVVFFILVYHFLLALYLQALKFFRKTIIFPGG